MEFTSTGKGNSATIGLSLLGAISAFSIWSAVNPSFFTIREFSTGKKSSINNVRWGMRLGLVLDLILGAGLAMAYGKKGLFPGILTGLTGIGLYGAYEYTLGRAHINNPDGKTMESYHAVQGSGGGGSSTLGGSRAYQAGLPPGLVSSLESDPDAITEDIGPYHISKGGGYGGGLSISGGGVDFSKGGGPGGGLSISTPFYDYSRGGGPGGGESFSGGPGGWGGGGFPGFGGFEGFGGFPGWGYGGWGHRHHHHHHRSGWW